MALYNRKFIKRINSVYNITYPTPYESNLGTPLVLPTSETSGQGEISYTLTSANFPTFNKMPYSVKYTALVYNAGKNNDASSRTPAYRALKNGAPIATGNVVVCNASYYWTHSYYNFYDVNVGDTLLLRYWAPSSTNVDLKYQALIIIPTRLLLTPKQNTLIETVYAGFSATPTTLTLNNPQTTSPLGYNFSTNLLTANCATLTANGTITAMRGISTYNHAFSSYGDTTLNSTGVANATYYPRYLLQNVPNKISFVETNLVI